MKKLLIVLVALVASLSLTACKKAKEYKLGMGVVVSTASTTNATEEKAGNAQIDATVAAVVLDEEGKIVTCRIDAVQNKIAVSAEGVVTVPTAFKTKMELGVEYGMSTSKYSSDNNKDGKVLEWDVQTKLFEEFVVGKTGDEVAALTTQTLEKHECTTDADLLAAGCTIQITDFKAAVAKACKDAQAATFTTKEEFTLGVAANSYNDGSANATEEAAGKVQVYSDFAATVVIDGKIAAALNDAIQPKFAVTAEGALSATFEASKRELKEKYGMSTSKYSSDNNKDGKILEWFEQSALFSNHVAGMTGEEVAAMTTQTLEKHECTTDAELLAAGCTIQITGIKAVVAKAAANVR